jgi:hypothetical protein
VLALTWVAGLLFFCVRRKLGQTNRTCAACRQSRVLKANYLGIAKAIERKSRGLRMASRVIAYVAGGAVCFVLSIRSRCVLPFSHLCLKRAWHLPAAGQLHACCSASHAVCGRCVAAAVQQIHACSCQALVFVCPTVIGTVLFSSGACMHSDFVCMSNQLLTFPFAL